MKLFVSPAVPAGMHILTSLFHLASLLHWFLTRIFSHVHACNHSENIYQLVRPRIHRDWKYTSPSLWSSLSHSSQTTPLLSSCLCSVLTGLYMCVCMCIYTCILYTCMHVHIWADTCTPIHTFVHEFSFSIRSCVTFSLGSHFIIPPNSFLIVEIQMNLFEMTHKWRESVLRWSWAPSIPSFCKWKKKDSGDFKLFVAPSHVHREGHGVPEFQGQNGPVFTFTQFLVLQSFRWNFIKTVS